MPPRLGPVREQVAGNPVLIAIIEPLLFSLQSPGSIAIGDMHPPIREIGAAAPE